MSKIQIKPISELLNYNFFIPSYQRGYRWTEQQVTDLLKDINEFSPEKIQNSNETTWYCLQPIVVKQKSENEWDVIDGQQRLTTIYLILYYLNKFSETNEKELIPFKLEYETREGSANYLKFDLGKIEKDYTNIDYYHISVAYKVINDWFVENKVKKLFKSKFYEFTKVIWYETGMNDDSIDIFTRINSGKIPLTNAELIKALFLNRSNFENEDPEKIRLKQLEIASEWDRIESALQNNSFWYFLNKTENNISTRIDFIFNLIFEIHKIDNKVEFNKEFGNDEYSTFRFFSKKFDRELKGNINDNWNEIKKYFQTLEEWYYDSELYHKIGYLITICNSEYKIKDILQKKKEKTKSEFIKFINEQISKTLKVTLNNKSISDLEYGSDNVKIIIVLLLHNIITTLKSDDSSLKFPFDKYKDRKNGGWSLEHIHAQNSKEITEIEDFLEWLKSIDREILTDEIRNRLLNFEESKKKEDISLLIKDISLSFGDPDLHSIDNMALLSKNDNSKLNNGLFPVKRSRIIELEKTGAFIPPATKKVFQKYYEGCTKQLSKWDDKDRSAYLADIRKTLELYLS
jgi:uncharacterized protein with ParB-like and HNH nuclease domain